MAIKRSGDGVEPAYLDRCNQHRKVEPIPFPSEYAEGLASKGPSRAMHPVANGPSGSAANYHRRKDA